jgi:hypothetical protein
MIEWLGWAALFLAAAPAALGAANLAVLRPPRFRNLGHGTMV